MEPAKLMSQNDGHGDSVLYSFAIENYMWHCRRAANHKTRDVLSPVTLYIDITVV